MPKKGIALIAVIGALSWGVAVYAKKPDTTTTTMQPPTTTTTINDKDQRIYDKRVYDKRVKDQQGNGQLNQNNGAATFDVEIINMNLAGLSTLPLGTNYAPVLSNITIQESQSPNSGFVDSFFDVFFDITVQDNDPNSTFGGMNNSAKLQINGANVRFQYDQATSSYTSVAGTNIHIGVGDLNDNSSTDYLKFTQFVLDFTETTVPNTYGTNLKIMGAVSDDLTDPPFGPLSLTGPTTANSRIPGALPTPEPSTWLLVGSGLLGLALWRRK